MSSYLLPDFECELSFHYNGVTHIHQRVLENLHSSECTTDPLGSQQVWTLFFPAEVSVSVWVCVLAFLNSLVARRHQLHFPNPFQHRSLNFLQTYSAFDRFQLHHSAFESCTISLLCITSRYPDRWSAALPLSSAPSAIVRTYAEARLHIELGDK